MATTAATLIQRTRLFMGDYPDQDGLTTSMSSAITTFSVADNSFYSQGYYVQIDQEVMYVTGITSTTTVNVRRGVRGTTAATHASAATIFLRPHFFDAEYVLALNAGINASFPMIYQEFIDETTVTVSGTYEYTIPTVTALGIPMPFIWRLSAKITGDLAYRKFTAWELIRGGTPKIKMRRDLPPGLLRIQGFGPIEPLVDSTSSLNALFPVRAEDALTMYAAQYLLASGEARRVREDTGARDDREQANREGSSMQAAQAILQRFQLRLQQTAMPPLPKNIQSVI